MFNWRASLKKPTEALYQAFKTNHPEASGNQASGPSASTAPSQQTATAVADALDGPANSRTDEERLHQLKHVGSTPREGSEPWTFGASGLTPSIMDPNSHAFQLFDHLDYYPPTPGGAGTMPGNASMMYHHPPSHQHAGFAGTGMSTPLSMPTSEAAINTGHQQHHQFHGYQPNHMHGLHLQQQHPPQQQFSNMAAFHLQPSFPPHQFHHHTQHQPMDPGFLDEQSPIDDLGMDLGASQPSADHSPQMLFRPQPLPANLNQLSQHLSHEKFRFHATLNAPTAMVAHADEIPITYLNKGQSYTLNVVDTQTQPSAHPARYRTFVRISFQDEQQRQKPAQCWQLWKEGRGTNEAHQRGGRLQAVEYVDSALHNPYNDPTKAQYELESSSFDGFCVRWTPASGSVECPISVRFNFLSTDFSHSKGVKGIPVRLCAKTEVLEADGDEWAPQRDSEVSYCMVKLFRDHGAERKLSNDVAHVKKSIDKVNQQIAQIESGMRDFGKRRRSGSVVKLGLDKGPGKAAKHRRTWSTNSMASHGGRGSAEEELHRKLAALQDRFTSTRPASILHLRGEEGDDPDAFPVKLSGDDFVKPSLPKQESGDSGITWEQTGSEIDPASSDSPTPSDSSRQAGRAVIRKERSPAKRLSLPISANEWRSQPQTALKDLLPIIPEQGPAHYITKVQTRSPRSGAPRGSIIVTDVDPTYEPPAERVVKPIACFYVLPLVDGRDAPDGFHRAVYLTRRTVKDFNNALAAKCSIEPTLILRTLRMRPDSGVQVLFDDDCVRELPEGQDMTARFELVKDDNPLETKREWNSGPTEVQCDGEVPTLENFSTDSYQLVLQF